MMMTKKEMMMTMGQAWKSKIFYPINVVARVRSQKAVL
jgi:hypothetical protein